MFTSNFERSPVYSKRYLFIVFVLTLPTLVVILALNLASRVVKVFPEQQLLVYQLSKVPQLLPGDLVIVGDSSGGTAIDVNALTLLTGKRVVSLSLTQSLGFLGSRKMISLAKARGVRDFLIIHAPNSLHKETPKNVDRYIDFHLESRFLKYFLYPEFLFSFGDAIRFSKEYADLLMGLRPPPKFIDLKRDFTAEGPELKAKDKIKIHLNAKQFSPRQIYNLMRLGHLCTDKAINCWYAHGTIHQSFCSMSLDHLAQFNEILIRMGMRFLSSSPYCMPDDQVGDAELHIRSGKRFLSTAFYGKLLSEMLSD